jgi:phage terminase large subunit
MIIKNIRFAERENGFISIYEEPRQFHTYVIGGDTAGEGSDYFTGQVIDNTDGHQAAALRHQFDEDLYARQMYCLGTYYNDALIGIEVNYSTYPIKELERLRYPRLYVRQAEDTFTHKMKESFGFMTTGVTRPVIIAALVEIMRDTPEVVCDFTTLGEMLTFVYNEHRRPEAMDGAHDDCVMAMAIAHYIRPQQSYTASPSEAEKVKWTDDMWEDYQNSPADIQKYLIQKWGNPK